LKRMGYGFSVNDGIVLSWGGLRGALGITLALEVDLAFPAPKHCDHGVCATEEKFGSQMLLTVGGMAILSLLINGMTTGPLLNSLGMMQHDKYKEVLKEDVALHISEACKEVFDEEVDKGHITEEQREFVQESIRSLNRCRTFQANRSDGMTHSTSSGSSASPPSAVNQGFMQRLTNRGDIAMQRPVNDAKHKIAVRELFLGMLRSKYMEMVDHGELSSHGQASLILGTSIDVAMDSTQKGLCDWKEVMMQCKARTAWWVLKLERLLRVLPKYWVS